jgi:hypothetical protein
LPDEEEEEGVRVNFAMKMTGITGKKKKRFKQQPGGGGGV